MWIGLKVEQQSNVAFFSIKLDAGTGTGTTTMRKPNLRLIPRYRFES